MPIQNPTWQIKRTRSKEWYMYNVYESMVDAYRAANSAKLPTPRYDPHSSDLEGTTFFIMSASSEANLWLIEWVHGLHGNFGTLILLFPDQDTFLVCPNKQTLIILLISVPTLK